MKKESASRRKKLPLLLGALLIISVAAYGTRAYFSDSESMQGDIKLELGNVDIEMEGNQKWIYTPQITEDLDANNLINKNLTATDTNIGGKINSGATIDDSSNLKNVRPGDSFTKKFIVKNNNSLDVKLTLNANSNGNNGTNVSFNNNNAATLLEGGAFIVTIENSSLDKTNILEAGGKKEYTVKITIPYNLDTKIYNLTTPSDKKLFNYMGNQLTVTAVQTNVK